MLSALLLPPGYTVRILLRGGDPLFNAELEVRKEDVVIDTIDCSTARLDVPGQLQEIVDGSTKRGVRAMTEGR